MGTFRAARGTVGSIEEFATSLVMEFGEVMDVADVPQTAAAVHSRDTVAGEASSSTAGPSSSASNSGRALRLGPGTEYRSGIQRDFEDNETASGNWVELSVRDGKRPVHSFPV
ncbi:hypothetical protein VKT23_003426 [Stygiomarasmius scandens]|uniref:Uncharacterized protein n=1 Tax=Marasmiellus scandens TaxID=2682957 RepID=A0ABR1JX61_9AGAR